MPWGTVHLLAEITIALLAAAASLVAAGHVLLFKRDPRSAFGWFILCLTLPLLGPLIYATIGINRVRRRALDWRAAGKRLTATGAFGAPPALASPEAPALLSLSREEAIAARVDAPLHLAELRHLGDALIHRPIAGGNDVTPLFDGEQAYPAMLDALHAAQSSIHLSTYIFDTDRTGREIVKALIRAAGQGVQVRVLIDALGEKYSWPRVHRLFRGSRVEFARFLPLRHGFAFNLRNHRKIVVVDGTTGFTGGMNLGDRHLVSTASRAGPVSDIQFRVRGPVVTDLQRIFLEDWFFATGQLRDDRALFPSVAPAGEMAARAVDDGPDESNRKLHWMVMGAIACAAKTVRIMTPYFIPDRALLGALGTAALRGVKVRLLLPGKNNLVYMHWAARAYLGELLPFGIEVRYQPPPFVHSKLLLIDDAWSLLGSANLDPRSLRLNFELDLEVWNAALATRLAAHFDDAWNRSTPVTLPDLDARPLWQKLRDGATRLASPYL